MPSVNAMCAIMMIVPLHPGLTVADGNGRRCHTKARNQMNFAEALEQIKKGKLIRRKGTNLWCWMGESGRCYYGTKRNYPLQFRDSWLNEDVFADDREVKHEGC